ncbi:MAG: hypothetical protein LBC75_02630 [Fibromonadaceae bacterium]|jgi:hypothetical protein|nr:hypothetical protein [Fibromonadaceae bacterium]
MLPVIIAAAAAMAAKKGYDAYSRNKATERANKALASEKINADSLNADTQALMNPNIDQQIQLATEAAMGQFGGSGNLYSSAARNAVADRAQAIASNEWTTAAERAMAMRQKNKELTAAIQGNKIANSGNNPFMAGVGGAAEVLGSAFS